MNLYVKCLKFTNNSSQTWKKKKIEKLIFILIVLIMALNGLKLLIKKK